MAIFANRYGELIGSRYRILRVLGAGGMGEVARATDLTTGRDVAIKVPHPHRIERRRERNRFEREARALRGVDSPHVSRILETGTWALPSGALPYIVFELLDGVDLATWLRRRGPLPIGVAAEVLRQACCGVVAAHDAGIVHRDLKPANLFLARERAGVCVKVLDFGVARPESLDERTSADALVGSPAYMAPEQMRPSATVERRTDVWALGIVLYEAITGEVPFSSAAFPDLCLKILLDPPRRPVEREVPDALWSVLLRCLAKEPEERFANVRELLAALTPFAVEPLPLDHLESVADGVLHAGLATARVPRRRRSWIPVTAMGLASMLMSDVDTRDSGGEAPHEPPVTLARPAPSPEVARVPAPILSMPATILTQPAPRREVPHPTPRTRTRVVLTPAAPPPPTPAAASSPPDVDPLASPF